MERNINEVDLWERVVKEGPFPSGVKLWTAARYATALSSVSCLCARMEASISHDPRPLSRPNS